MVKTRIAKTLGPEKTLRVYKKLLQHTREETSDLPVKKFLFYADAIDPGDEWDDKVFEKHLQSGGSLGKRMQAAFETCKNAGYNQLVIIGSDCYDLTKDIILQAFGLLDEVNTVIGPAKDGGYYLLGMDKVYPQLFELNEWSTTSVFSETTAIINHLSLSTALLRVLNDVDEEKDINFDY